MKKPKFGANGMPIDGVRKAIKAIKAAQEEAKLKAILDKELQR